MKQYKKTLVGILGVLVVAFVCNMAIAAEQQTIIGEINEDGQFLTKDGKIYDLGESDTSQEVAEMNGKKVTITGNVSESEGTMIIDVVDYEVME